MDGPLPREEDIAAAARRRAGPREDRRDIMAWSDRLDFMGHRILAVVYLHDDRVLLPAHLRGGERRWRTPIIRPIAQGAIDEALAIHIAALLFGAVSPGLSMPSYDEIEAGRCR